MKVFLIKNPSSVPLLKLICILLTMLLTACSGKEASMPSDVLPVEKMTQVYLKIHLLESVISAKAGKTDTTKAKYRFYEDQTLASLGVSRAEFETSKAYYSKNPVLFNKVYEAVIDSLGVRERTKQIH